MITKFVRGMDILKHLSDSVVAIKPAGLDHTFAFLG